jgi:anti-sigma-K factor RskA
MMPTMTYSQIIAQIHWLEEKLVELHDKVLAANTALAEAEATLANAVANGIPDLTDLEAAVTEKQSELNELNSEYLQHVSTRDILMHNISAMRYADPKSATTTTEAKAVPAPEKVNILVVAIVAILVFGIAVIAFKTQRNG